jgi:hypothetical protein
MLRRIVYTSFGAALLVVLASSSIGAMGNAKKTTYFTFSKSVQLPGVALSAGTYIFEVVNPYNGSDVVAVLSRDRSKVYLMRITNRISRPLTGSMKAALTLSEVPPGNPPAVKAWFPEGETGGHAFIH